MGSMSKQLHPRELFGGGEDEGLQGKGVTLRAAHIVMAGV